MKGAQGLFEEIKDELEQNSNFSDVHSDMGKSDNSAVNKMTDIVATSFLKMIQRKAAEFQKTMDDSTSPLLK